MNDLKASLREDVLAQNKAIEKVYFKILKEIAELSKSFPDPDLRLRVEIDLKHYPGKENEIFELLTPYVYLVLTRNADGHFKIGYAINDSAIRYLGQTHFTRLIRIIYSNTNQPEKDDQDCLEVFPYYSDVYEEARHFASNFYEEDTHYKLVQEKFKGQ